MKKNKKNFTGFLIKIYNAVVFLFSKYIFSFRKYSIASRDLQEIKNEMEISGEVIISEIDRLNVSELNTELNQLQKNKTLIRLSKGMRCFIARIDGNLAGISWISYRRSSNEGVKLTLNPGEALLLESFTFPEYRKRGVQTALIDRRLFFLKETDYRKVYVIYEPGNEYSIRALKRNGFTEMKSIMLIRIFNKYFQFDRK